MTDLKQEAHDPNTSPERLAQLLYGQTSEVLKNPALPLILLENPGWFDEIDTERLLKLLNTPELPAFLIESMAQDARQPIAINAKMHVALGTEVTEWEPLLKNLAMLNCGREDRIALEQHELIPRWLRSYLPPVLATKAKQSSRMPSKPLVPLPDSEAKVIRNLPERERENLASATHSAAILHVLSRDSSRRVQLNVASNSKTSEEDLQFLKAYDHCWDHLASNPAASIELLSELAEIEDPMLYYTLPVRIAMNRNCTTEITQKLQKSAASEAALARFYTIDELAAFFQQGKAWAALEAKRRENAPLWLVAEGLMLEIQKRRAYLPWFCGLLATDDQKRLTKNVRSANWFTRFAIAIHPSTKSKTLEKLITDANRYVRFAAKSRVGNPDWNFASEVGHG